ncbi:hypothetical protein CR159_03115 [Pollutimonas subterranea]|uniref:Uncharacterized protein n=1 Tax=Pollutimonas subterranea TaxID=2045210 RepID=A0A2N4U8A6_9BURK|nr:hypothetical protein [Pollutimonas subterranea]PLC51237.1 hypothetical protein CR159_03115 [Pollutimonas subterranea]
MFQTFVLYALPFSFTLLVACALTSLVSALVLLLFRLRKTNEVLRHPYLKHQPWERYPLSIRAAILLDYFLRLAFPKSTFWIAGEANRLLPHIEPVDVPIGIKWPIIGLWAGCFIGTAAMLVMWALILLTMNS